MWPAFSRLAAVALTAVCVKIVDDAADRELDALLGRPGLLAKLGASAPAYASALLALAVMLAPVDAVSLFVACYAVGMAHAPLTRQAWGGRAWQESAVLLVVAGATWGVRPVLAALGLAGAVQIGDSLLDGDETWKGGGGWLPAERLVATGLLWGWSLGLDPLKAGGVLVVTVVLWWVEAVATRGRER